MEPPDGKMENISLLSDPSSQMHSVPVPEGAAPLRASASLLAEGGHPAPGTPSTWCGQVQMGSKLLLSAAICLGSGPPCMLLLFRHSQCPTPEQW